MIASKPRISAADGRIYEVAVSNPAVDVTQQICAQHVIIVRMIRSGESRKSNSPSAHRRSDRWTHWITLVSEYPVHTSSALALEPPLHRKKSTFATNRRERGFGSKSHRI